MRNDDLFGFLGGSRFEDNRNKNFENSLIKARRLVKLLEEPQDTDTWNMAAIQSLIELNDELTGQIDRKGGLE